jgi:hypothetical protein
MTPEDVDQLKKQNALLLRALQRSNRERDELAKQLAAALAASSEDHARV